MLSQNCAPLDSQNPVDLGPILFDVIPEQQFDTWLDYFHLAAKMQIKTFLPSVIRNRRITLWLLAFCKYGVIEVVRACFMLTR